LDWYFLGLAVLSLVLGAIIVGRGLILGGTWNYLLFGILLLAFGGYRVALFLRTWRQGRNGAAK
jgi:hypothetical protein